MYVVHVTLLMPFSLGSECFLYSASECSASPGTYMKRVVTLILSVFRDVILNSTKRLVY